MGWQLCVALDETTSAKDLHDLFSIFGEAAGAALSAEQLQQSIEPGLSTQLSRTSPYAACRVLGQLHEPVCCLNHKGLSNAGCHQ